MRGGPSQPWPGAGTRLFALLGDPVSHSLSPRMHNAAFEALHLDAAYAALRVRSGDEVAGLLRGLARAGGGGNVTLPHKEAAARAVDEPSPAVIRTGACNTFWCSQGRVFGDNTDVEGVRRAVLALGSSRGGGPLPPGGAGARRAGPEGRPGTAGPPGRVLLLGAGGSARAVAVALLDAGATDVVIRNRTPARAEDLAALLDDRRVRVLPPGVEEAEGWDLVVNATSLGLAPGDALPLDPDPERVGAILDLVYGPRSTSLVNTALSRGIPAADGTEMLLQQGMVAFERWWGSPAPETVMRAALAGPRI